AESLLHKRIAAEVEDLQDMAFALGANFEDSILATALGFVSGRIEGVRNGIYSDDRYDFRSSLSICKSQIEGKEVWLCLLNTLNPDIKSYFELLPFIKSFKYTDTDTSEDNQMIGSVWHNILEQASWNAAAIGFTAQLTFQPDMTSISQDTSLFEKLKPHFSPEPELRKKHFCKRYIVQNYVSKMIGKTDISQISPVVLTDFFMKAFDYVNTDTGLLELNILEREWEKAFLPVALSNISSTIKDVKE
nr:hypothetical protein [Ruminococcus sp.]